VLSLISGSPLLPGRLSSVFSDSGSGSTGNAQLTHDDGAGICLALKLQYAMWESESSAPGDTVTLECPARVIPIWHLCWISNSTYIPTVLSLRANRRRVPTVWFVTTEGISHQADRWQTLERRRDSHLTLPQTGSPDGVHISHRHSSMKSSTTRRVLCLSPLILSTRLPMFAESF